MQFWLSRLKKLAFSSMVSGYSLQPTFLRTSTRTVWSSPYSHSPKGYFSYMFIITCLGIYLYIKCLTQKSP